MILQHEEKQPSTLAMAYVKIIRDYGNNNQVCCQGELTSVYGSFPAYHGKFY